MVLRKKIPSLTLRHNGLAARYPTEFPYVGFWSRLNVSPEELWYNETVCLWMTIYIYVCVYMCVCVCVCAVMNKIF